MYFDLYSKVNWKKKERKTQKQKQNNTKNTYHMIYIPFSSSLKLGCLFLIIQNKLTFWHISLDYIAPHLTHEIFLQHDNISISVGPIKQVPSL